jgi:hypothetical protein
MFTVYLFEHVVVEGLAHPGVGIAKQLDPAVDRQTRPCQFPERDDKKLVSEHDALFACLLPNITERH